MEMDGVLAYHFDEIEYSVRQEVHSTSVRFHAALEDLRTQLAPLHEVWTREAAAAYRAEQLKWHQSATELTNILMVLGNAVRDGAADMAAADRRAAGVWGR